MGVLLKYNWGAPAHTFFGPQINWQKQVNVYCKKSGCQFDQRFDFDLDWHMDGGWHPCFCLVVAGG